MIPNTIYDLMNFFSIPGRMVTLEEAQEFWFSLSAEEKQYYSTVRLY